MQLELLDKLRKQNPVVLNAANFVTVQDVANGLNAIGASPIMSNEIDETSEMVNMASAVAINMGSLTKLQIAHMKEMGDLAREYKKPIVLDPVAVGAVQYRLNVAQDLLWNFHVGVIRGNAGEIAALGEFAWNAKGIDAGSGTGNLDEITMEVAKKYHCTVIASGATDTISDGNNVVHIHNGTPLFQAHVGSGDMLTSIVAAFCAVTDSRFEAAQAATLVFGSIGQLVVQDHPDVGPGSFGMYLMDYLAKVQVADIKKIADYD
ncbi:hydroxyethylthiazole kinase [Lactobacillus sp. ESL0677]|uniref:hydroxyethylthiazole kinase n=1 Tax=Lactobacillus sp. ESL0677 TaxID=2983208 RepID=UPI0023FA0CF6|nr:hydroxyethylthiazole kinase [Lactobacillus sp. ESL0677]WEV36933.1 hydroxyethylthiazole kinase [Lactobacillus sp. ESL0677]